MLKFLLGKFLKTPAKAVVRKAMPQAPGRKGLAPARKEESSDFQSTRPVLKILRKGGATEGEIQEITTEQEMLEYKLFFDDMTSGVDGAVIPRDRQIGVATWLDTKIIPVLVQGRKDTIWILVSKEHADSDELSEVVRSARQKSYQLHPDFQVVVFSEAMLLAISRGSLSGKKMTLRRKVESNSQSSELFNGFRQCIKWAYEENAADIDFRCSRRDSKSYIGFSIAGKWVYPERWAMPSQMMRQMLGLAFQFGEGSSEPSLDMNIEQQLRIYISFASKGNVNINVMLRWASMAGDDLYSVTCRLIPLGLRNTLTMETLGYLPTQIATLNRALNSDGGAVILSGVVNSGKSTTISTIMGMIPGTRKIVTLEDPVEFMIPGAISNTVARPLTGGLSPVLAAKLRTLKRTGFNDLLLGEIRDQETGAAAQDVFESGQKLYTTVHTGRAWMIPDRLSGQSIGIPREVLSTPGNLRLLANQSLIPKCCTKCRINFVDLMKDPDPQAAAYWRNYGERLKRLYDINLDNIKSRNKDGCDACRKEGMPQLNGFSGRTSAAEMIEPDDEFCKLVSKGDNVGILRYLEALRGSLRYDDPDMTGKSSMDCAVYKMSIGEIDPLEIEPRYTSFEAVEMARKRRLVNRGNTIKTSD